MFKKSWLVSMLLIAALLVTACGGGTSNNSSQGGGGAAPSPTPNESASTPAPEQPAEDSWEAVLEAASKESLVIGTGPGERDKAYVDAFAAAYPEIDVQHTGIRPSDIAPRVISEQENGRFLWDVMIGSSSTMTGVLSPAGAFDEMGDIIKTLPNYDDSKWHDGLEIYTNDKSEILLHALKPYKTIYVNREHELADQFQSVDDLINPVFKGKIVIDTPMFPTYGSINLAGVLALKGEDFVKKIMVDQEPIYMDNIMTTTDWLGSLRYPVTIGGDESRILELNRAGQCLKCEPLDYGAIPMLTQGVALFKNHPNKNAAKVFLNWIISKEGQTAYNQSLGLVSRRVDVENFNTIEVDWDTWQDGELIGTEAGSASLNWVIDFYKSLDQ